MLPGKDSIVSELEYKRNQAFIQQAQALLDNAKVANEEGRRKFDKMQRTLLQKIEEGKAAEALLQSMAGKASGSASGRPQAVTGPPMQEMALAPLSNHQALQLTNSQVGEIIEIDGEAGGYNNQSQPQRVAYGALLSNQTPSHVQKPYPVLPDYLRHYRPPQGNVQTWPSQLSQPSVQSNQQQFQSQSRQVSVRTPAVTINQRRQALPMQPVMQRPQAHAQPIVNSRQSPNMMQGANQPLPVQQIHQVQNAVSSSIMPRPPIPNFVTSSYNPDNATLQQYIPPTSSSSSSLAGALDVERSRGGSKTVQSGSPLAVSRPTPLDAGTHPQGQFATSNAGMPSVSTAVAVPSAVVPSPLTPSTANATNINTHGMYSSLSSFNPLEPRYASELLNGTELKQLHTSIDSWVSGALPGSTLRLPGSSILVNKDDQHRLHLIFPDPKAPSNLFRVPLYPPVAKPIPRNVNGKLQPLPQNALTAEQQKRYHPYSTYPHPSLNQSVHPSASAVAPNSYPRSRSDERPIPPPSNPSSIPQVASGLQPSTTSMLPKTNLNKSLEKTISSQPTIWQAYSTVPQRTPTQANRKTLARDILWALNPNRPRLENKLQDVSSEPPPGWRAPIGASLPSTSVPLTLQANASVDLPPVSQHIAVSLSPNIKSPAMPENADTAPALQSVVNCHYPEDVTSFASHMTPSQPPVPGVSYHEPPTVNEITSQPLLSEQAPGVSNHSIPILGSTVAPTTSPVQSPPGFTNALQPYSTHVTETASLDEIPIVYESEKKKEKIPLFLPSTSPPPVAMISSDSRGTYSVDAEKAESQTFYVLVPPLPDYAKKYKTQQLKKARRQGMLGENAGDVENGGSSFRLLDDGEVVIDIDPTSNGFVNGDSEREAVILSCSRLRKRPCKWNGCDVILNSVEKLIQHLSLAHRSSNTSRKSLVCLWQQCGRREMGATRLFYHVRTHAIIPLLCAYRGCDESFRTARQLAKHHRAEHRNDTERPSTMFFVPDLETPAPIDSSPIPSYLIEPVLQPSISKDRHYTLGPLVLLKIAGPVKRTKRYNAAHKLLRSTNEGEESRQIGGDPYDFLSFPSTSFSTTPSIPAKIREMEDLDSGEVSEMAHYSGMMFWGGVDSDEDIDLLGSPLARLSNASEGSIQGDSSESEVAENLILSAP